jgi:hypothetical protein
MVIKIAFPGVVLNRNSPTDFKNILGYLGIKGGSSGDLQISSTIPMRHLTIAFSGDKRPT